MAKWLYASSEHSVATTQDVDPLRLGRQVPGVLTALVHIYEPGDDCEPHPTLPTLADLLARQTDPETGLLTFEMHGVRLTMDPALRELGGDLRASIGCRFVPRETLEARGRGTEQPG